MRILAVTMLFHPHIGGAEKQAHKLSKKLIEKGVQVELVTGWWYRGTPARETIDGLPVVRCFTFWQMFGIKGLRKFGAYLYLLTLFFYLIKNRRQYDVIHIHQLAHHAFASVMAGKLVGKKSIIKVGNSGRSSDIKVMLENRQVWGSKQMLPKVQQYCDRIIAISNLIGQELLESGFRPDQILPIPNGVEIDQLKPKTDYAVSGCISMLYVGRLHWQKGPDVLLSALQKMTSLRPELDWRLTVLGTGPMEGKLKATVQEYGLIHNIDFRGTVDNVPDFMGQADMIIIPSRTEGLSNTLLEAMATGLPCLVTNITANAEVIQHEYNGLLTPEENDQAMAQAILRLVDDQALREKLGKQARQTVIETYALDTVAERYIELYESLLAQPNV